MINFRVAKLAKFFDEEFKDTSKILIVAGLTGYELFGRFKIEFTNPYFRVSDINSNKKVELSSLKNAVAWCILTDCSKYDQSQRLHLLDLKLSSLSTDTMIHRKKLKSSSTDSNRVLYKIKLQEDSYKKKLVIHEIDMHVKNSKLLYTIKTNTKKQPIFKYKR